MPLQRKVLDTLRYCHCPLSIPTRLPRDKDIERENIEIYVYAKKSVGYIEILFCPLSISACLPRDTEKENEKKRDTCMYRKRCLIH